MRRFRLKLKDPLTGERHTITCYGNTSREAFLSGYRQAKKLLGVDSFDLIESKEIKTELKT